MPDAARLYLITPVLDAAESFVAPLTAALEAAEIASVLLRPAVGGASRAVAAALAPIVQAHGAAALIADDPALARAVGADGVHVLGAGKVLASAIRSLKPDGIVGVGGLATRDDAMMAGEAGADYLLFGDPIAGEVPPFSARCERVSWWAEIFQVPCVAWAHALAEVEPLAAAGAEFIALSDVVWGDLRGPAAAVRDAAAIAGSVADRLAAEIF